MLLVGTLDRMFWASCLKAIGIWESGLARAGKDAALHEVLVTKKQAEGLLRGDGDDDVRLAELDLVEPVDGLDGLAPGRDLDERKPAARRLRHDGHVQHLVEGAGVQRELVKDQHSPARWRRRWSTGRPSGCGWPWPSRCCRRARRPGAVASCW